MIARSSAIYPEQKTVSLGLNADKEYESEKSPFMSVTVAIDGEIETSAKTIGSPLCRSNTVPEIDLVWAKEEILIDSIKPVRNRNFFIMCMIIN